MTKNILVRDHYKPSCAGCGGVDPMPIVWEAKVSLFRCAVKVANIFSKKSSFLWQEISTTSYQLEADRNSIIIPIITRDSEIIPLILQS